MLKNHLSSDKDQEALLAELDKEHSDAKTVIRLLLKATGKSIVQGALTGAVAGGLVVAGMAIYKHATDSDED